MRLGDLLDRFDAFDDWLDLQDHARAAAEGAIIDFVVLVAGPATDVVQLHVNQAGVNSFL
jgi:hypothetical protein